jgi:hypothetical protein
MDQNPQGKPIRKCTQLSKIRASEDSKARSTIMKHEDINSTCIWGKHYSKDNNSLVNGENRVIG